MMWKICRTVLLMGVAVFLYAQQPSISRADACIACYGATCVEHWIGGYECTTGANWCKITIYCYSPE